MWRSSMLMCDKCGEIFSSASRLEVHIQDDHIGARPFVCDQCGKRFKRQTSLGAHQTIRCRPKVYNCRRCNESFTRKADLDGHKCPKKCLNGSNSIRQKRNARRRNQRMANLERHIGDIKRRHERVAVLSRDRQKEILDKSKQNQWRSNASSVPKNNADRDCAKLAAFDHNTETILKYLTGTREKPDVVSYGKTHAAALTTHVESTLHEKVTHRQSANYNANRTGHVFSLCHSGSDRMEGLSNPEGLPIQNCFLSPQSESAEKPGSGIVVKETEVHSVEPGLKLNTRLCSALQYPVSPLSSKCSELSGESPISKENLTKEERRRDYLIFLINLLLEKQAKKAMSTKVKNLIKKNKTGTTGSENPAPLRLKNYHKKRKGSKVRSRTAKHGAAGTSHTALNGLTALDDKSHSIALGPAEQLVSVERLTASAASCVPSLLENSTNIATGVATSVVRKAPEIRKTAEPFLMLTLNETSLAASKLDAPNSGSVSGDYQVEGACSLQAVYGNAETTHSAQVTASTDFKNSTKNTIHYTRMPGPVVTGECTLSTRNAALCSQPNTLSILQPCTVKLRNNFVQSNRLALNLSRTENIKVTPIRASTKRAYREIMPKPSSHAELKPAVSKSAGDAMTLGSGTAETHAYGTAAKRRSGIVGSEEDGTKVKYRGGTIPGGAVPNGLSTQEGGAATPRCSALGLHAKGRETTDPESRVVTLGSSAALPYSYTLTSDDTTVNDTVTSGVTVTLVSEASSTLKISPVIKTTAECKQKSDSDPHNSVRIVPVLKTDGSVSTQVYNYACSSFVSGHNQKLHTAAVMQSSPDKHVKLTKHKLKMAEIVPVKKRAVVANFKEFSDDMSRTVDPSVEPSPNAVDISHHETSKEQSPALRENTVHAQLEMITSPQTAGVTVTPVSLNSVFSLSDSVNRKDVVLASVNSAFKPKPIENTFQKDDQISKNDTGLSSQKFENCENFAESRPHLGTEDSTSCDYLKGESNLASSEIFKLSQIPCAEFSALSDIAIDNSDRYAREISSESSKEQLKTSFVEAIGRKVITGNERNPVQNPREKLSRLDKSPSTLYHDSVEKNHANKCSSSDEQSSEHIAVHMSHCLTDRPAETDKPQRSPVKSADVDNSNLSTASQGELLEILQNLLKDIPKQSPPKSSSFTATAFSPVKNLTDEIDISTALNLTGVFENHLKTSPVKYSADMSPHKPANRRQIQQKQTLAEKCAASDGFDTESADPCREGCESKGNDQCPLAVSAPEIVDENTMDRIIRVVEDLRALGNSNQ